MELLALKTVAIAMALGVSSYILARWFKIPAILFYLICGVVAGPVGLGVVRPDALGTGLITMVEITVAIILFEGGLSLTSHSFRSESAAIHRILSVTLPLTGIGAALLGHYLLGLSWRFSAFFGALIVVTGPTVIGSILKSVYLTPRVEILLNWESIWGDVIGVLLSALALEMIALPAGDSGGHVAFTFVVRILAGVVLGLLCGVVLSRVLGVIRRLRDPSLSGIVGVAGALATFTLANTVLESSGPLAVVVAGFFLSRLRGEILHEMRHFKEQISCLFISTMFVVLSAYIDPLPLLHRWPMMILVALILGALVRPAAALLALSGTAVSFRERLFIGLIGPRGIIAVATAAYAAFIVKGHGEEMAMVLNLTFAIIFFSGAIATLFCRPLARWLGVLVPRSASGILIVGVNPLSAAIAEHAGRRVPVTFLDTSSDSCSMATVLGHETLCTDILDADVYEDAAADGFGRLLVITRNDALNKLVAHRAAAHMDAKNVYRARGRASENGLALEAALLGRVAFSDEFEAGEAIARVESGEAYLEVLSPEEAEHAGALPLLEMADAEGGVRIVRHGRTIAASALCLVDREALPKGAPTEEAPSGDALQSGVGAA